jgi:formylglycine-generating enzyme required for sulfatase activity
MKRYTLYILVSWFLLGTNSVSAKTKNTIPDSLQVLRFEVNDIPFSMQRIETGVFLMGGTREQHHERLSTDLPTHTVALNAYYISHTEVTQSLWKAVMPEWEIMDELNNPNYPITDVSWYDCQVFIHRLDSITGMPFRLPTEAEWEFAARGGNETQGFRFAGGNILDSVSWGLSNGGFRKHTVGLKKPNELGLYDMTGNVSEWCSDWYAPYYIGTEPNPKGPITGDNKIVRGGSFDNCQANSHISYRHYQRPEESTQYCGLRLAMTLPNEPTLQVTEEPTIVKRLKLKNMKIKLVYVAAEIPYYISEEPITHRVWNKVMDSDNVDNWSEAMVDKTEDEWNIFLEKCRKVSREAVRFATNIEIETAIESEITQQPKQKAKKQHYWEKDVQSVQRHRRHAKKAQKWADLIGVQIKTTGDPTLIQYSKKEKNNQPRWLVIQ